MIHKSAVEIGTPSPPGDPMEIDEDRLEEEKRWAYGHSKYWADNYGDMKPSDAEEFAKWFTDGWLAYLSARSDLLDGSFLMLRRQFQEEISLEDEAHNRNKELCNG